LQKCENKFSNLFPLKSKYSGYYKTPNEFCLSREVSTIEQLENIPHGEERIFISTLTKKILRDKNDPDLLEKRSGVLEKGQTKFVDVRFKDDTGEISGRISNKDYVKIGKEFFEKAPIDSELLVKSVFYNGFRFAFLTRWKRLDE
jgi:hypothetical protein